MNPRSAALVASALAACLVGASTGTAEAAAPIRTEHESTVITLNGKGHSHYHYRLTATGQIRLSPGFAQDGPTHVVETGKPTYDGWDIVVNGIEYIKAGNGHWTHHKMSAAMLKLYRQHVDTVDIWRIMKRMPGLKHVGRGHYRATGSLKALGPYAGYELNYDTKPLQQRGIKTLTIDITFDKQGRFTKVTYSGSSSQATFSASDTFNAFNKPVTIKAPH
jgi:hypothetical protein